MLLRVNEFLVIVSHMTVFLQICALFALMAVGYALARSAVVDQNAVRGMSALIVKATLPALIVMSMQKPFSRELLGDALETLAVAALFYAGIIALSIGAAALLRVDRRKAGAFAFALSFSNCAFVGFPVVESILGADALFLTSIHNILFNVLAFSVGILIMSGSAHAPVSAGGGGRPGNSFPLAKLFNINVIAAFAGFALFILSIRIPEALAIPMRMLGGLTTPLAMVVTGAMLARTPIRSVLGDWRLYAVSALRLAVWPLVTALVLRFFGVGGQLYAITVIVAAMPSASNTSMIAEVYGGDTGSASSVVFLTTLFSVVTIPALALLLV